MTPPPRQQDPSPGPLRRVEEVIIRIEKAVVVVALATILLTAAAQMVIRQLGGRSLGTDELAGLAMVTLVFIGASLAVATHEHITIDLASFLTSARVARYAHAAAVLVITVFAAVFAYYAVRYLGYAASSGEQTLQLHVPLTTGTSIMVLGAVLMFLHSILALGRILTQPAAQSDTVEHGTDRKVAR